MLIRDLRAVRRPRWVEVGNPAACGQLRLVRAVGTHRPHVTVPDERDLRAVIRPIRGRVAIPDRVKRQPLRPGAIGVHRVDQRVPRRNRPTKWMVAVRRERDQRRAGSLCNPRRRERRRDPDRSQQPTLPSPHRAPTLAAGSSNVHASNRRTRGPGRCGDAAPRLLFRPTPTKGQSRCRPRWPQRCCSRTQAATKPCQPPILVRARTGMGSRPALGEPAARSQQARLVQIGRRRLSCSPRA